MRLKKEGFNFLNHPCRRLLMKSLLIFVLSSVFPDLLKVIPVSIHVNVLLFSVILVVVTMVGTAFFMYNAFGKPFETLHGPPGLYLLSFISGEDKILPLKTNVLFNVSKDWCPHAKLQYTHVAALCSIACNRKSGGKYNCPTVGNPINTLW